MGVIRLASADHPRSRGVYGDEATILGTVGGSSPLARGLRPRQGQTIRPDRIIPARAGFTEGRIRSTIRSGGSSPLARGLLRWVPAREARARIIPARAGFTRMTGSRGTATLDHPRSRGVYASWMCRPGSGRGSSPLARGLPPPTAASTATRCGSSPLARGLPEELIDNLTTGRIIPARAGFTHFGSLFGWRVGDHPRSRGVYAEVASDNLAKAGSSPLARGLPEADITLGDRAGIIPARAGFTRP